MLGVIGWNRTKAGPLGLRAFVISQVADVVTLEANGLWTPEVGDTITDGTLTDVVVRVISTTVFHTRTSTGFVSGFHDITPKLADALPDTVHLRGNVVGSDDVNRRETKTVIGAGNTIEDTISGDDAQYHPVGWEYASIVLITPTLDAVGLLGAHWASWQNVKLIVNVNSGPERLKIADTSGTRSEDDIRLPGVTNAFPDIFISSGEAALLVRHPIEDRWRGHKVRGPRGLNVVSGLDNVLSDTDEVISG
jgi:hypothetical protein